MTLCFSIFFGPDAVTEVKTDIYVTSFGPVSDTDMVSVVPGKVRVKNDTTDKIKCVFSLQQGLVAMSYGEVLSQMNSPPSPSYI